MKLNNLKMLDLRIAFIKVLFFY